VPRRVFESKATIQKTLRSDHGISAAAGSTSRRLRQPNDTSRWPSRLAEEVPLRREARLYPADSRSDGPGVEGQSQSRRTIGTTPRGLALVAFIGDGVARATRRPAQYLGARRPTGSGRTARDARAPRSRCHNRFQPRRRSSNAPPAPFLRRSRTADPTLAPTAAARPIAPLVLADRERRIDVIERRESPPCRRQRKNPRRLEGHRRVPPQWPRMTLGTSGRARTKTTTCRPRFCAAPSPIELSLTGHRPHLM